MELRKIIDNDFLQIYSIKNPNKEWLKKFPNKSTILTYDLNSKTVMLRNTNELFNWNFFKSITYVFTTVPEQAVIKMFQFMIEDKSFPLNKKCGLNACNQTLYTDKHNVVISLFSLNTYKYPPTFIDQSINIVSNYEEIINLDKNKFKKAIMKIFDKNNKPIKSFVDFVEGLQENFPLNYMITIRRFYDVIKESDLKTPKENEKQFDFYIGYDIRSADRIKENNLIKHMEELSYSNDDSILLYETYNNPMSEIIKQCKSKNISYEKIHKHCIKLTIKDYNKLNLISTICDYL